MWLLIIIIILILYIIIVAVRFSRVKKTTNFNYLTSPPQLANLPLVDQYQSCYDVFGNVQYNLWFDPTTNRTLTSDIVGSTGQVVAKTNESHYVYLLAQGRLSCFPLPHPFPPSQ
jgi:hypothetical protein